MKFRKLAAGIMSAVMLATSALAMNVGAYEEGEESIEVVKLTSGEKVTIEGRPPYYSIELNKAGKVEVEINCENRNRYYFSLSKNTSDGIEADKIIINNKEFTSADKIALQDSRSIWEINADECQIEYTDTDSYYVSSTAEKYTTKYIYNNINAGTYVISCGDYGFKSGLSFTATFPSSTTVKAPAATKLFATAKKNKLTLSWDKVSGAEKYQICLSTDGGKTFKAVAETSGTKATIKLKKGTSYKFAVRSYKTVNGKKVYSKFSNVKSVKY